MFWGESFPIKKRKHDSKPPIPLGAVGTIKPIDHDKQKITNKRIKLVSFAEFTILKQKRKPMNFDKINPISIKNALKGKKEVSSILFSNFNLEEDIFNEEEAIPLTESIMFKTK